MHPWERHADNAYRACTAALPMGDEHGLSEEELEWLRSCQRALDTAEHYLKTLEEK